MPRVMPMFMVHEYITPHIHEAKIFEYKPSILMKISPYMSVTAVLVSVTSLCVFVYKYTHLFKKKM